MRRGLLVYNPASGDQRIPLKLDAILAQFQEKDILLQPFRLHPGELPELREILSDDTFDLLIVTGGDGTLNIVVNLMRAIGRIIPLGIVPTGTCNDFARSLSLPNTLEACLDVILQGNLLQVDVGVVDDRTAFLSTCSGGMFVETTVRTDSDLKRSLGPIAYYLNAINEMVAKKTFRVRIETESGVFEQDEVLMFLVLNGAHAGGFTGVLKQADMCDGLMDIILIKNCGPLDLADMFFKVLWQDIQQNRNVMSIRAKTCTISTEGEGEIPLSIDGEAGGHLPIRIRFEQTSLPVFVPQDARVCM